MKKVVHYILSGIMLTLMACSSTPSLQEYYVDNAENPNFISLDLPASILNLEKTNLTDLQREALQSLRKLNVLAFRKTTDNAAAYTLEKDKVNNILGNDDYVELVKLNSKYGKGVIKYLGEEDAIDEVVIFGNSDDKGFALIRVLGDNMNPAYIMQLLKAIQNSDYDSQSLGAIGDFLKG
jgi:Icc-related predicted phosphoesterase